MSNLTNYNYDTVFFDLDGTITDSAPGILASVRYALIKFEGVGEGKGREWSDEELNFFIGPPLIDSFSKLLGCGEEEAKRCLKWYREFYTGETAACGMLMNSVYPGIPETLGKLRRLGVKVVLATAKPEVYARRILEHFDLVEYFDYIHGATLDEGRNKKHQVIAWALEHSGELGRVVMVGDRENDISGAKINNLPSIGVLWGYGDESELKEAGADYIVKDTENLINLIKE